MGITVDNLLEKCLPYWQENLINDQFVVAGIDYELTDVFIEF